MNGVDGDSGDTGETGEPGAPGPKGKPRHVVTIHGFVYCCFLLVLVLVSLLLPLVTRRHYQCSLFFSKLYQYSVNWCVLITRNNRFETFSFRLLGCRRT